MIALKIIFYYFRYLNGFLLRLLAFKILEILKNKNFKFFDDDYKQINDAAENLTKLRNPYEDSNFRKGPILPFLFLINLFSEYNFMKIILLIIDLTNSILIEILLNLQQRKLFIKRNNPVERTQNNSNKKFLSIIKIYNFFKFYNGNNPNENNENAKKTHNEVTNNKTLSYFSHLKFDILNSINNKENNFNYLLTNEKNQPHKQENKISEDNVRIKNKIFDKLSETILSILDNKYSTYSLFYLYNPIIIFSVAKGNYDPLFFMLIFLILISIELNIYALAGALYGISIHFEFIPLLYLPGIILYIFYKSQLKEISNNQKQENDFLNNKIIARFSNYLFMKMFLIIKTLLSEFIDMISFVLGTFFSLRPIKFILTAIIVYAALFILFYLFFGDFYINDMFFYHIFSKNERLNFSIFNYVSFFIKNAKLKKLLILSVYIVQLTLVILSNLFFYKDINQCLLIASWTYVIFSKEVYLRNVSWIFILLCVNIHSIKNLNEYRKKYYIIFIIYTLVLMLWGYNFYLIEINGINNFFSTWFFNLIFFFLNCIFLNEICSNKSHIVYFIS